MTKVVQDKQYYTLMDKLLKLPSCVLVATGRTGSDFLHTLLDSHEEVLTFNGTVHHHTFWEDSRWADVNLNNFLDEYIKKYRNQFESKYDIINRKDQLGVNHDQSLSINIPLFKSEVTKLLRGRMVTSKSSLIAIYAAYAICLGQDINKKTLFFHNEHSVYDLDKYFTDFLNLKGFPDSKIICMTRDPRANFVSGVENWRRYDPTKDRGMHLYFTLKRIMEDAGQLKSYSNYRIDTNYCIVRVEDLGQESTLRKLAKWLNQSIK